MKIRTRLTLWFTLLVGFLMISTNLIVWFSIRAYLYDQSVLEAKEKVNEVEEVIIALAKEHQEQKIPFNVEDPELLSYTLSEHGTSLYEGAYLQVANLQGNIFSSSPNLQKKKLPVLKTGTIGDLTLLLPLSINPVKILYFCAPLFVDGKLAATLQVGIPLMKNESLLRQIFLFELGQLIVAIAISFYLGKLLSRQALTPMVRITNEVKSMAGRHLLKLLETSSLNNDEIKELAETFNGLLNRITNAFELQKRFVSDASHELRSPLTAIRGHAQLLQKRGRENPEMQKEGLEIIINEAERLSRLVDDMLLLARSEKKTNQFKEINITGIVYKQASELQLLYPNIRLPEDCKPVMIRGDEEALKRVFINLLDNAIRAAGQRGSIQVDFHNDNNNVEILIIDNGPGIDQENISHVFERFYRVDSARDRDKGGSGLGLSIVSEIVEIHQGKVYVESTNDRGTTFTVKLPVLSNSPDNRKLQKSA
jgi:two-component system sensor histidine kinase ArlS